MKKIKIASFLFVLLAASAIIALLVVRSPSYTIKTSGKLYIVNKLSSDITVFDLFKGEEITKLPIKIEPHEAVTLSDQKNIVVTNYGDATVDGKSVTVINTKNNTIEKEIALDESLRPHGIMAFPNSNTVGVVTDSGNHLLVVNVETGIIEKKIPVGQKVSHLLVLHPKKPWVYVTNMVSSSVSVIDIDLGKVIKIIRFI